MAKNAPAMDRSIERSIAMAAGRGPSGDLLGHRQPAAYRKERKLVYTM